MVLRTAFPGSFCSKKLSALPVDTHPERRGLFECTDSPQKADFVGMCTSLPCQKKKPVVTQARLELATPWPRLQVVSLLRHPRCTHFASTKVTASTGATRWRRATGGTWWRRAQVRTRWTCVVVWYIHPPLDQTTCHATSILLKMFIRNNELQELNYDEIRELKKTLNCAIEW